MGEKQQSKQLLILAGPSCSGKSTLLKKISEGQLAPSIYKQLQIKDLSILPVLEDRDIRQMAFEQFDGSTILHYDLFNNYINQNYHQNILQIIEKFDCVTIITLFVPSKVLLNRIQIRLIQVLIKLCLKPSYFRVGLAYFDYQWNKYQKYLRSDIANQLYREWDEFTRADWVSSHWVLNYSQEQLETKPVKMLAVQ